MPDAMNSIGIVYGVGSKSLKNRDLQTLVKILSFVFLFIFLPCAGWAQTPITTDAELRNAFTNGGDYTLNTTITITGSQADYTLSSDKTLTITGTGTIKRGNVTAGLRSHGTLNMTGITFDGDKILARERAIHTGGKLSLTNCTIKDIYTSPYYSNYDGHCLYVYDTATLDNCIFTGCVVTRNMVWNSAGILYLTNCTFSYNNSSSYILVCNSSGSSLYEGETYLNKDDIEGVTNIFIHNTATAAIACWGPYLVINRGTTISNNTGTGIIITDGSNVSISNANISNNGRGIYIYKLLRIYNSSPRGSCRIENTIISNNTNAEKGGGICFYSNNNTIIPAELWCDVSLSNVEISGNTALEGGGICMQSQKSDSKCGSYYPMISLDNVRIINNTATRGGGVYSNCEEGTITISNSTISNNDAQQGGGVYYSGGSIHKKSSLFTLSDNTISDNSATKQGGGIYIQGVGEYKGSFVRRIMFTGTNLISNNTAGEYQDGEGGGGFYVQCKKNISNSTDDRIPVLLDGVTISNNTAHGRGGGLYVAEEGAGTGVWQGPSVQLQHCTITGNMAKANPSASTHDLGNGGGIYAHGSKLAASNPYTDGYLKVIGGTIAGNQALRNGCPLDHYCIGNGGGVYAYAGTIMLSGVNIGADGNANSAYRNGGGVFVNEHADVTLNGATDIAYNTAVNGAGIYALGNLTMDGSTFTVSNNTATGYGGGINLSHAEVNDPEEIGFLGTMSYSVDPSDSSFVNPGVFNYRIYNSSNTLVGDFPFDNDDYEDLLAPGTYTVRLSKTDGISDFSSLTSLTLAISDIDGSITPNGSAPIANETDITFTTFTDGYEICTFTVRSPIDLGGTLTMSNGVTLSGNTAANGGGLFLGTGTAVTLTGGSILYNTATSLSGKNYGGGIYINAEAALNINGTDTGGVLIKYNHAKTAGGGVYKLGSLNVGGLVVITDNTVDAP